MENNFCPDFNNYLDVLNNKKPKRIPLYEHNINESFISKFLGKEISMKGKTQKDLEMYYNEIINFWKLNTYDGFSFEAAICDVYPDHGAIFGGRPGPIQSREDFMKYPFEDIPQIFWEKYTPHFEAIRQVLPSGMKAYGGCGYGIFESAQDLVGYEYLCVMQYMDPDLFRDVFIRIGLLYEELWTELVKRYDDIFVFYRMGDDLGFKSATLLEPETIKTHILPQYKKIINIVHGVNKKFLLHSCGNIFNVMDDIIECGIDAKHSNEDEIAPFEKWIELYAERIGLFGGIDVNTLCLNKYEDVYKTVLEKGRIYRDSAKGYGIGSGNSIAEYVSVEGFQAMIDAVKELRRTE